MINTPPPASTAPAQTLPVSRRYYLFMIAYMVLLSAFGSFVNDMYLPCLPEMVKVFGCSVPQIQLSLTMGMIGLGAGEIIFGPISDKYGRRPVLLFALVIFLISAVASVFSRTLTFFLICRLVQGLGGSAGYFLARTIPADTFAGRTLARFMGIIGAINGLAPALAPVAGGLLEDHTGWKGVFITLAAFSLVLMGLYHFLRESLPAGRRQTRLSLAFAGYGSLLRNKGFMIHAMLKSWALGMLFAYIASSPFIIETHFGYSATSYGLFVGLNAIFLGAGSLTASRFHILKKAGYVAAWLLLCATAAESAVMLLADSFWPYQILMFPIQFAMGMLFTTGNTLAMNEGRGNAGGASGLLGVFGYIIGAAVSPIVGMGDIMHTTAWVFLVLAAITLVFGFLTRRFAADLDIDPLDQHPTQQK